MYPNSCKEKAELIEAILLNWISTFMWKLRKCKACTETLVKPIFINLIN